MAGGGIMSTTRPTRTEGVEDGGNEHGEGEAQNQQLTMDEIFEILSCKRRRHVLHHLKQQQGTSDLGTLAEHIAGWENDKVPAQVRSNERKNVYTALRQFHLPKMDEKGVVEFDSRAGTVELSEQAADIDIYLDVVSGYDVPWSLYYTSISVIFGCLLVAVHLSIGPLARVTVMTVTTLFLVTVIVFSLIHTYTNRKMRIGSSDLL